MVESSNRLRNFVARLLEHEGALVDQIEPEGLEVIAPPSVRQTLKMAELERLGFAAELPAGAQRVGLESDWLERLGQVLGKRGKSARVVLQAVLPPLTNAERIVEHGLVLQNAVYRLTRVRPAWTRYLILLFRYTAFSDEKREGIIKLGLNLANGSALDAFVDELLAAAINAADKEVAPPPAPPAIELPPDWTSARLNACVTRALPPRVDLHLAPFLRGMQRRLERDLARVHDYYEDLRRESLQRLQKQTAETARERLRLEATAREYHAKVADLRQKYALRVEVEWIQTLELVMPVERIELLIKRRKRERRLELDWNPLARKLDAPPCEWRYLGGTTRVVCDDALHLVSPPAHDPCASCGKAYCRACHPLKCPKCHQAGK